MSEYGILLQDPRWQKKRLEVYQRDNYTCRICKDDTKLVHVHHLRYKGKPWEVENKYLITLCDDCHSKEHEFRKTKIQQLLEHLDKMQYTWVDVDYLNSLLIYIEKDEIEDLKFCMAHKTKDLLLKLGKEIKDEFPDTIK